MSGIDAVTDRERRHYTHEDPPLRQPPSPPPAPTEPEREVLSFDFTCFSDAGTAVRFTHVGHGFDHAEYATFGDAVAAARDTVREIDGCPGTYTRAFIALRQRSTIIDRELVRWEVFHDRVELDHVSER